MKRTKSSSCIFCSTPFITEKMNQVHCSIKCRILSFVEKTEKGCWVWKGSLDKDGYGLISIDDKSRRVHRISYEAFKEKKIPFNKNACHHCDNPSCVNPDHVFIAESYENTQDMIDKGRSRFSGSKKVLNKEKVAKIKQLSELGFSKTEIGRMFEIEQSHVAQIIEYKIWKHV